MKNVFILYVILIFISCGNYGTEFIPTNESNRYSKKTPCEVRIIFKFAVNEESGYIQIGTCTSTTPAGKMLDMTKNNAIEEIRKCACENGGDLLKIIETDERSGVNGGLVDQLNPNAKRVVYSDMVTGELYRKK